MLLERRQENREPGSFICLSFPQQLVETKGERESATQKATMKHGSPDEMTLLTEKNKVPELPVRKRAFYHRFRLNLNCEID